MIIETCPKCGHDLMNEVLCTYPPIPRKVCGHCGWSWTGKRDTITRVPFVDSETHPCYDCEVGGCSADGSHCSDTCITLKASYTHYEDISDGRA